jgi:hypothetical protein
MAYFRIGNPQSGEVVSPILSQAPQTTNAVIDQAVYARRMAEAATKTPLWNAKRGLEETHMLEVGYAVFTESAPIPPSRSHPGSYPLVYTDLGGETVIGQGRRRFVGFAYANTPAGVGIRGEGSMQLGTVAVQVGGVAPFWSNFEVLQPGTAVRVCDPETVKRGGYDVDLYRNDRMTKESCIHATIRAATRPNWRKPDNNGDGKLTKYINAVNAYYASLASDGVLESGYIDVLVDILSDNVGGGAFTKEMFSGDRGTRVKNGFDYAIPQQLVSAVDEKYAASIIGVCTTYTPPRCQGAVSF